MVEKLVLLQNIGGLVKRPRKHELPVYRDGLSLEGHDIEAAFWIIDQAVAALWGEKRNTVCRMNIALRRGENEAGRTETERLHLRGKRLAMVDNVMGAKL